MIFQRMIISQYNKIRSHKNAYGIYAKTLNWSTCPFCAKMNIPVATNHRCKLWGRFRQYFCSQAAISYWLVLKGVAMHMVYPAAVCLSSIMNTFLLRIIFYKPYLLILRLGVLTGRGFF
jgi:hypothetical protein